MPPRGVKKGTKRARQYEHIKESELEQGVSEERCRGDRCTHGQQGARPRRRVAERSRTSTDDISSGRRGGLRSGTNRPKGRTYEQLYNEARQLGSRAARR